MADSAPDSTFSPTCIRIANNVVISFSSVGVVVYVMALSYWTHGNVFNYNCCRNLLESVFLFLQCYSCLTLSLGGPQSSDYKHLLCSSSFWHVPASLHLHILQILFRAHCTFSHCVSIWWWCGRGVPYQLSNNTQVFDPNSPILQGEDSVAMSWLSCKSSYEWGIHVSRSPPVCGSWVRAVFLKPTASNSMNMFLKFLADRNRKDSPISWMTTYT